MKKIEQLIKNIKYLMNHDLDDTYGRPVQKIAVTGVLRGKDILLATKRHSEIKNRKF